MEAEKLNDLDDLAKLKRRAKHSTRGREPSAPDRARSTEPISYLFQEIGSTKHLVDHTAIAIGHDGTTNLQSLRQHSIVDRKGFRQ